MCKTSGRYVRKTVTEEGDVECKQREVCIETNKQVRLRPNRQSRASQLVLIQELSLHPPSVLQVPMADAEPTDLGEVSLSVSMLPSASVVSDDEEDKEEDDESSHVDGEEDVDDIKHDDKMEMLQTVTKTFG